MATFSITFLVRRLCIASALAAASCDMCFTAGMQDRAQCHCKFVVQACLQAVATPLCGHSLFVFSKQNLLRKGCIMLAHWCDSTS